jgi:hypothetical protein
MIPDSRPPVSEIAPPPVAAQQPAYRWYHKVGALIFIVFCMEVGTFLLVFPWSVLWEHNFFSSLGAAWRPYWDNAYLRGAISGLGILNLYISLVEIFRLRRFTAG